MKCSTCGSEYHLRQWCPRGKGKGKNGKGPSGGLPSTWYTQQVSGGLSELPTAPRSGIISAWLVTNGGPNIGQVVPYAAPVPPPEHPPPHIEE
eukprot:5457877-Prorocentrum_lima.AAC.1